MKWCCVIIWLFSVNTAYCAINQSTQNSPANPGDKWFEYASSSFQQIYEKGLYHDYKYVIRNADRGITLIRDTLDFQKYATYYFHKGYAYKVQLQNDSAHKYLSESITYAALANDVGMEVRAITQMNYLLRFLGRNNETGPFVKRLSTLLLHVDDINYREAILTSLSEAYLYNGNYKKAIAYILPFIPTKEERFKNKPNYANRINLGSAYANLGNMYLQIGQRSKATYYLNLALPKFYDYAGATVRTQNSLLNVYLKREMVDSAIYYYRKVYESNSDRLKFYESAELANANLSFAEYYLSKRKFNDANQYAKRAVYFSEKSERLETILKTKKLLASIYFEKSDYKSALYYLNQILPQAHIFNKDFYNEILILAAKSYEGVKNYQQALHYFQIYNSSSVQSYEEKSDEEILNVQIKYQTKEKQKEIDNLILQRKLTSDLLKSKNQLQLFLVVFVVLLIFIAGLIYKNYSNKKAANKLLEKRYSELEILSNQLNEANITKAKLFSIISHDLRSPVSELFAFLKMQESYTNLSPQELSVYQQRLLRSSTHLLETMEDLLIWSKSQLERFEIEQEDIVLSDLFDSIISLLEISLSIKNSRIQMLDGALKSVVSDYNILLTIMRNLLQNAINNVPDNGLIKIQTFTHPRKCIVISNPSLHTSSLEVEELAKKKNYSSNSNGLGMILVKELVELLHLEVEFSRTENEFHVKLFFS